jgi:hypothetical protein
MRLCGHDAEVADGVRTAEKLFSYGQQADRVAARGGRSEPVTVTVTVADRAFAVTLTGRAGPPGRASESESLTGRLLVVVPVTATVQRD